MDAVRSTRYAVDATDRLVALDEQWDAFAQANGAPRLERSQVLGRSLWDFISDPHTVALYKMLLARVRENDTAIILPLRCDSPDRRRYMRLVIAPLHRGSARFDAILEREEARPRVALLDPAARRSGDVLVICSWCKRVRTAPDEWLEVEDAVVRMNLFEAAAVPQLSHGICPECERIVNDIAEEEGGAEA